MICVVALFPFIVGLIQVGFDSSLLPSLMQIITLTLLLEYGLNNDFEKCMKAFSLLLEIYTYVNFFSIIIFPNGMYESDVYSGHFWFLGYKNVMIRFFLPALCVNSIWTVYKFGKYTIRFYLLLICMLYTEWIVDCKTGLIGIFFVVIMLFMFSRKKLPKFINAKNVSIIVVVVSILFATTSITDVFNDLLVSLGEEASIGHRINIWKRAIEIIIQNPIFGYGLRNNDEYKMLLNVNLGYSYISHPHNYVLYTLIQGGLMQLVVVGALFFRTTRKCMKNRDSFAAKMIMYTYIAFFIMGITESLVGAAMLYPLAIITDSVIDKKIFYKGNKNRNLWRKTK